MSQERKPPYYAVIFTSERTDTDPDGYAAMSARMVELAEAQPGFLGLESVRGPDGVGVTISYWDSAESIQNWHAHAEHRIAQEKGRSTWYARFKLRVCRVEREYEFSASKR